MIIKILSELSTYKRPHVYIVHLYIFYNPYIFIPWIIIIDVYWYILESSAGIHKKLKLIKIDEKASGKYTVIVQGKACGFKRTIDVKVIGELQILIIHNTQTTNSSSIGSDSWLSHLVQNQFYVSHVFV